MSHFTVLVTGPNLNSDAELERLLQPYHEYECTGHVDEYVIHVDKTQEYLDSYEGSTDRRIKLPDGRELNPYSKDIEEFKRPATAEEVELIKAGKFEGTYSGFKSDEYRVYEYPEGTDMNFKRPTSELQSIEDYLEGYYGISTFYSEMPEEKPEAAFAVVKDDKLVHASDFTNPDRQWDWWVLGGRWQGMLRVKPGMEEHAAVGRLGTFGVMNGDKPEFFDLARKDALDFDTMKAEAVAGRQKSWDDTYAKMRAIEPSLTEEEADAIRYSVLQAHEATVKIWQGDTTPDKPHLFEWAEKNGIENGKFLKPILDYFSSGIRDTDGYEKISDWIVSAPALGTYAAIVDGKWVARGEMGWFGMSRDTESRLDWDMKLEEVIKALPDDHYLAVVDCHI